MASSDNLIAVRFYNLPILNEAKSKESGRPVYDDLEVCEQKYAGDRQKVGVFPAHEPFKKHVDPNTGLAVPWTYAMEYPEQFKAFRNGEAQAQSGTPIEELPFLTQSKRLELKALNIFTAEALAALDGQPLKMLGPGGRELKDKAQAYLDNAAGSADITKLTAEIARLRDENERLKRDGPSVVEDDDGDPTTSPFAQWESDDIKNWIEETTGEAVRGNPSHATLVKRADKVNADLARKAQEVENSA